MSDNSKIKRGISYLVIEKGVTGCISIAMLPLIIRMAGINTFGLWGLLLGLFGYIQCIDFGVMLSLERYVAFYKARNDNAKLQDLFSTGLTYLLLFTVFLFVLLFFGGKLIISTFVKDASVSPHLLIMCFPGIAANTLLHAFMCIPRGFQQFNISSKIQIGGKIVFAVSVLILLYYQASIYALVTAYNLQNCMLMLMYAVAAKKLAPFLKFFRFRISAPLLKTLIQFGYKIQISYLSNLVMLHFDKILLSYFFGLRYVGYYEAATRIVYAIRDVPLFLMSVVTPRVSELISQNNLPEIKKMYSTITQQLALFSVFLMTLLLSLSTTIIELVIKESVPFTYMVYIVLSVACFWHVISAGASYTARGMGKTSVDMITSITSLILNIVFSLIFLRLFAYNGVVFGTALAMIISPIVCYLLVNRMFSLPLWSFFRGSFLNHLIYLIISCCIIFYGLASPLVTLSPIIRLFLYPVIITTIAHLYYSLIKDTAYKDLTTTIFSFFRNKIRSAST